MTPFEGSSFEKECVEKYNDITKRRKSYAEEGARLWTRQKADYPGFAGYAAATTRTIAEYLTSCLIEQ